MQPHEGGHQAVGAVGVGQGGGHHRVQGGPRGEELAERLLSVRSFVLRLLGLSAGVEPLSPAVLRGVVDLLLQQKGPPGLARLHSVLDGGGS